MIFPSKITTYEQSILSKLPILMNEIEVGERNINKIYMHTQNRFNSINEFIYAIDLLFILDVISEIKGEIIYVKADK